jgi:hypothetical protein
MTPALVFRPDAFVAPRRVHFGGGFDSALERPWRETGSSPPRSSRWRQ